MTYADRVKDSPGAIGLSMVKACLPLIGLFAAFWVWVRLAFHWAKVGVISGLIFDTVIHGVASQKMQMLKNTGSVTTMECHKFGMAESK